MKVGRWWLTTQRLSQRKINRVCCVAISTMNESSGEAAVGIVAHTNTCPGFSGILKQVNFTK